MSNPTLSKQPVCGVSLACTVNTWLFSNELDDKLGAGNSHWATGWGEASVPYSHWPIYSENAYWTPTVCHCIKCWILFPFDLLYDTRRLPMPQFFVMYVLPRHFKSSVGSHLSITCIDCTCIVSILCLLPSQPSVEFVAGHLSSTLCVISLPALLWPWLLLTPPFIGFPELMSITDGILKTVLSTALRAGVSRCSWAHQALGVWC